MKTEYPLKWPSDVAPSIIRVRSPFRTKYNMLQAIAELERACVKYKAKNPVLFTNIKFDSVGEPIQSKVRVNPGAAVTAKIGQSTVIFTCDKYDRLACNVRSIAETILSYHKIKSYGTSYRKRTATPIISR